MRKVEKTGDLSSQQTRNFRIFFSRAENKDLLIIYFD